MSGEVASVFDLRREGGAFAVDVPSGWLQGRGAFGGLVAAWLARAAEGTEADPERALRTLAVEIVGPVRVGPARLTVEPLRIGNGVSTYDVRLLQTEDGGLEAIQAHAVASFGKRRVPDRDFSVLRAPSDVPPASEVEPLPIEPPLGPEFAQHLEFRGFAGLPMSAPLRQADGGAKTLGYVRMKVPPRVVDVAYLAAVADAYWPAILATEPLLRPTATLSFTLDLVVDPASIAPDAPLLVVARALAGRDGYVVEERQVFEPDGRLVALNRQTFVIIK
jgi:hypothetical protein